MASASTFSSASTGPSSSRLICHETVTPLNVGDGKEVERNSNNVARSLPHSNRSSTPGDSPSGTDPVSTPPHGKSVYFKISHDITPSSICSDLVSFASSSPSSRYASESCGGSSMTSAGTVLHMGERSPVTWSPAGRIGNMFVKKELNDDCTASSCSSNIMLHPTSKDGLSATTSRGNIYTLKHILGAAEILDQQEQLQNRNINNNNNNNKRPNTDRLSCRTEIRADTDHADNGMGNKTSPTSMLICNESTDWRSDDDGSDSSSPAHGSATSRKRRVSFGDDDPPGSGSDGTVPTPDRPQKQISRPRGGAPDRRESSAMVSEILTDKKLYKRLLLAMVMERKHAPKSDNDGDVDKETVHRRSDSPDPSAPLKMKIIPPSFLWKSYPPLESLLRSHMLHYYTLSTEGRQSKQQQNFNNFLVTLICGCARRNGFVFDVDYFSNKKLRDRIRCFFKTHIQNARKRLNTMVKNLGTKEGVRENLERMVTRSLGRMEDDTESIGGSKGKK